MSLYVLT